MSEKTNPEISELLLTLLRKTKRNDISKPLGTEFAREALGPLYAYDMKAIDVLRVVLKAFLELVAEPQFQVSYRHDNDFIFQLLKSPIEMVRYETPGVVYPSGNEQITLLKMINGFVEHMLGEIHLCHIGWCREQLWPEESVKKE
jgi:hypothetical protein